MDNEDVRDENEENAIIEVIPINDQVQNKIIVTVQGQDWSRNLEEYNLTMDSSDTEIIEAIAPAIEENFNVSIRDYYKVQKSLNNNNIHVYPNSTAG